MSLRIHLGRYDKTKFKCLRVLESSSDQWVSSKAVISFSDAPFYSVARLLYHWTECQYVLRRPCLRWGTGDFEYKLGQRGKDWLNWSRRELPNAPLFEDELLAWRKFINPVENELLKGTFKECVTFINSHHSRKK